VLRNPVACCSVPPYLHHCAVARHAAAGCTLMVPVDLYHTIPRLQGSYAHSLFTTSVHAEHRRLRKHFERFFAPANINNVVACLNSSVAAACDSLRQIAKASGNQAVSVDVAAMVGGVIDHVVFKVRHHDACIFLLYPFPCQHCLHSTHGSSAFAELSLHRVPAVHSCAAPIFPHRWQTGKTHSLLLSHCVVILLYNCRCSLTAGWRQTLHPGAVHSRAALNLLQRHPCLSSCAKASTPSAPGSGQSSMRFVRSG
jgi:hypothetical protein